MIESPADWLDRSDSFIETEQGKRPAICIFPVPAPLLKPYAHPTGPA